MTASDPLLVPVDLQAMVLNSTAVNFVRAQMNYANLANCESPAPAPFQEDQVNFATDLDNHGVYLRWTLPRALRHAQHGADGTLDFPFVPNRWFVTRVFRPQTTGDPAPTMPQVSTWVVQSDFLASTNGAVFVDPTQASLTEIQIGQMVPVATGTPWQEPDDATPYFLRAVAESNAAFAAYQPFHQNVFSIHDPLQTSAVGAGTLSYFVAGWYSDASADILAGWQPGPDGTGFDAWLTSLGWQATAQPDGTTASVYHGAAFGVPWDPEGSPPPSPPDRGSIPQIAVGNSSVDGVVAFAEAAFAAGGSSGLTPQQVGDLLEAFQYNLLPLLGQPGAEEQIEQRIRDNWFGSAHAGTAWTIVDAPVKPGTPAPPPPSAAELAAEAAWLAALNSAQSQYDGLARTLAGLQRRLFELWWKQQALAPILLQTGNYPWNVTPAQFTSALDPTAPDGLIAQIAATLAQMTTLSAQIPTASGGQSLAEAITAFAAEHHLPSSRELKALSQPRFWAPSDPVVVLSQTAHMMRLTPGVDLPCRWPEQIVTAISIEPETAPLAVDAAQLSAWLPTIETTNLPAPTAALFGEFFLLDPANAVLVAAATGTATDPTTVAAIAAAMASPTSTSGVLPALLPEFPWVQPWEPLYLDWEVAWYPIPFVAADGTPNWSFDGTDYSLVSGVATPVSVALAGRSVLTPKPSFEFQQRIAQYLADFPHSPAAPALRSVAGVIDGWDLLSQTLSGFDTQLSSWSPVPTLVPPTTPVAGGTDSLADLIGAQAQCPPNPQLATPGWSVPPSTFEGMRGGQLAFARLTIVDVFGQTLEVVTTQTAPQTSILTADGLSVTYPVEPLDTAGLAQLPPRILQPARLDFTFTDVGGPSPIVGWLLTNHLDGGLAVYGPGGDSYGELLQASDGSGQPTVVWWPAPDTPFATVGALASAQPQLGGIVAALEAAGPSALAAFVQSIDETLWTVDPLGTGTGTASVLNALIGRPLAVVDASIALELQAAAWTDPAWPYTFADPAPQPLLLDYQFDVALGDLESRIDGLLGYFADGDYSTFNALWIPESDPGATGDVTGDAYLRQVGPGNWLSLGFAAGAAPGTTQQLTLVMDPRAAVHARSGILPEKAITLPPGLVEQALSAMQASFRVGPILAEQQAVVEAGANSAHPTLLTPTPATRTGQWIWREPALDGSWPSVQIAQVDASASFPAVPPVLRDGALQFNPRPPDDRSPRVAREEEPSQWQL